MGGGKVVTLGKLSKRVIKLIGDVLPCNRSRSITSSILIFILIFLLSSFLVTWFHQIFFCPYTFRINPCSLCNETMNSSLGFKFDYQLVSQEKLIHHNYSVLRGDILISQIVTCITHTDANSDPHQGFIQDAEAQCWR